MSESERIVWLASYPKCGNTWVRFMLYAYLYGAPKASIDVPRKIPDLHRPLPTDRPEDGRLLAKTHFQLNEHHPMLDRTDRAIHITRNPRDVVLSGLNYRRLTGEGARSFSDQGYVQAFIKQGGDPQWFRLGFGTWAGHARSWRGTKRFPVLGLRYEDLKADAAGALTAMLEFLGESVEAGRLEAAVKASSFDAMRAMEIREKQQADRDAATKRLFVGDAKAARKGIYFVNKGASGQSLDTIAKGLDEEFDRAFGADMAEFGYETNEPRTK